MSKTSRHELTVDRLKTNISQLPSWVMGKAAMLAFRFADKESQLSVTAKGLEELKPGYQDFRIFKELARISVLPTFETALMRKDEESQRTEILLTQRQNHGGNPDWWEGQWHVPGVVMLASDPWPENMEDFSIFRDRLLNGELGGVLEQTGEPHFLPSVLRSGSRGSEVTVRQLVPVDLRQEMVLPENARFFDVHNVLANPPEGGLVGTHDEFIDQIASLYPKSA